MPTSEKAVEGAPFEPGYRPMGWYLARHEASLLSLDLAYAGGSAWICVGKPMRCGVHTFPGKDRGAEPFVELFPEQDPLGFSGLYYLVRLTAAPPGATPRNRSAPERITPRSEQPHGLASGGRASALRNGRLEVMPVCAVEPFGGGLSSLRRCSA
jgi:hypothetical protein